MIGQTNKQTICPHFGESKKGKSSVHTHTTSSYSITLDFWPKIQFTAIGAETCFIVVLLQGISLKTVGRFVPIYFIDSLFFFGSRYPTISLNLGVSCKVHFASPSSFNNLPVQFISH